MTSTSIPQFKLVKGKQRRLKALKSPTRTTKTSISSSGRPNWPELQRTKLEFRTPFVTLEGSTASALAKSRQKTAARS